ncbi:dienelactone hydrolase [Xenophilus arseniciresistens]|uniref:Dienelactone hydrolase n=1 Tax=Xenophilus arseniciresistens TaxID=1283306 RepID=A0AAE3N316_9BURK|nr:dienelactone hydrolase [Xenophilus arseniciresistens]MDA7414840.1 dienelactone hydrolase [Xenophilus arseniciresistens]
MPLLRLPRIARRLLGLAALLGGLGAQATTGLIVLPATEGRGPLTVVYPTQAPAQTLQRGPFTLRATPDAPPAGGNHRLVVLSHGSGGSVWPHFDLAQTLVAAGFTVAMPLHAGDNFENTGDVGPVSWARRPQEVSQAIDRVAADLRFAPLQLDLRRVGMYGMSAGGLTALVLAGGRWSPAQLARHCEAHIEQDFAACVGLSMELSGGPLDGARIALARRVIHARLGDDTAWREWQEPRIAAVVAAVPMAAPFDMASLARPRVPFALVRAEHDAWLRPRWHSDAVHAACAARCPILVDMRDGGHGSTLSPAAPGLSGQLARLLADPPGFDRSTLPAVFERISDYFTEQLGAVRMARGGTDARP